MRHRRPYRPRSSRRIVAVLAGGLVATLALVAAFGGSAASAQTQVAPSNTALPKITGTTAVGKTLTTSPGTWSGTTPITFKYQWLRCDSNGNNCSSLVGETSNSRLLSPDDGGHRMRVRVTA